jgi:hypothetical protein
MSYPSEAEARVALHDVERARQGVIDQIGMPWWYWWGLAGCWVGLGVLVDLEASWWVVMAATLAVGAVHSTVFQRLLAGRQRSGDVKVRADVAGRHMEVPVIGFLVALVAVTIVLAFALAADGAGHPATWSSVFVAVLILLGGPRVMAWIRADATRRVAAQ